MGEHGVWDLLQVQGSARRRLGRQPTEDDFVSQLHANFKKGDGRPVDDYAPGELESERAEGLAIGESARRALTPRQLANLRAVVEGWGVSSDHYFGRG
jgi:hypothetical protein